MRDYVVCPNCQKIVHKLRCEAIKVEGQTVLLCQRCVQRLERQDTREYLEE
jgi:hypothetical protein